MKRITLVVAALVLLLVLAVTITFHDPNAPELQQLHTPLPVRAYDEISYEHFKPSPFEGGKMWVTLRWATTNSDTLLYSIDDGNIIGRLINGRPVSMTAGGKVVCFRPVSEERHLRERIRGFLESLAPALFKSPRRATAPSRFVDRRIEEPECYWLLNMKTQAATRMGELPDWQHFPFCPSPDFRRGYSTMLGKVAIGDLYCLDLERPSVRQLAVHHWASGWWDNTHILLQTTNQDFLLHDVTTDKTAPFLGLEQIADFLRRNGIVEDPGKVRAFLNPRTRSTGKSWLLWKAPPSQWARGTC